MTKSLETILNSFTLDHLPVEWQWREEDLKKFSLDKPLFEFQQDALKNALISLYLFYERDLIKLYEQNQIPEIKKEDANRMGFWMATGSGKTLVIVKVIEMLSMLMKRGVIQKKDILFLVHRDNLIDQFKKHINEYNHHNPSKKINLESLRKYDEIKRQNALAFSVDHVNLFYYRADLFFEKRSTTKKIDPSDYYNDGNWFVLLDEAHRGDRNYSTLKKIHNNFSRNGFIFNFSATFTDLTDLKTCAFNFNLEKFIQEGFGKQIYVSKQNIEGYQGEDDFSDIEKQRVVLKTLILQTYINQHYEKIKQLGGRFYHKPLLLTITNTVNEISKKNDEAKKQNSDLKLFFSEIEKIANNKIRANLFTKAKEELKEELGNAYYFFGTNEEIGIDKEKLSEIEFTDILKEVFNTRKSGNIEAIIRDNNQEIAFKVVNSDRPFALIRIGDTSKWMKDISLRGYEITQHYADDSFFESLNQRDSDINILMGSRTFYEGWDSNRPNIILFVNIGLGSDSKKFVLQSTGRGVRIEPEEGKRKRLQTLFNIGEIDENTYETMRDSAHALESLFVFGTNAKNVQKIISSFQGKDGEKTFELGTEFISNPDARNKLLLIPAYKESNGILVDEQRKYPISEEDLDSVKKLFGNLNDKTLLVKYDNSSPEILQKTRSKLESMSAHEEDRYINNPELVANRLLDYFCLRNEEFEKFKEMKRDNIIHFTKIKFRGGEKDYETLKKQISVIRESPKRKKELNRLFDEGKRSDYDAQKTSFDQAKNFEIRGKKLDIKYLARHYYHPLLVSHEERTIYLTHIIDVKSERKFIEKLEEEIGSTLDKKFDWWMFSKLDETLDDIYIPYYSKPQNRYAKFRPDFIFWFEKNENYYILFIDPKGTVYTDYEHKADGYAGLFGEVGNEIISQEHGKNIKVYLRFFGNDKNKVGKLYRKYWIDKISEIPNILEN